MSVRTFLSAAFVATFFAITGATAPSPATATTGSGCYQVGGNVQLNDVLNVRARPSVRAAIVYAIDPNAPPIISGGRSTADAANRCVPRHRPLASRWCPVRIFDGVGAAIQGWVKRRYLVASDCP